MCEHRQALIQGFTKKYGIKSLVYYEQHIDIGEAILREKQMKKWNRDWKIRLIEESNLDWVDLYPAIVGPAHAGLGPGLRRGTSI